jgi:hypothetical protein
MKWLAECSVAALREALEAVAPELAGYPVTVPGPAGQQDPLWHSGCVPVGDRFFVKFAWSHPAALRLARQLVRFLAALHDPAARQRAEAAVGTPTGAQLPPATTRTLRERLAARFSALSIDPKALGASRLP